MSTTVSSPTVPTVRARSSSPPLRPAWEAISRGVAMFWGLFLILQVFLWGDSFAVWWLGDLPFPMVAQRGVSAFYAVLLMLYAISDRQPRFLRSLTWLTTGLLLGFCLLQVWNWYAAKEAGLISSASDVPFVLQITAILSVIFAGLSQPAQSESGRQGGLLISVLAFDACLVAFPLAHLYCLGQTTDAAPASTILLAVNDLPEPSSEELMQLSRSLEEGGTANVILLGTEDRIAAWNTSLSTLVDSHIMELTELKTQQETPAIQETLNELSEESNSILLAGSSVNLSLLRIRALRAGLKPRQLLLSKERLPISTAFKSLPELWMTYLPLRKQDRL